MHVGGKYFVEVDKLYIYFVLLLASSLVHHFVSGLTRPDKLASDELGLSH